ncbi:hypothetical protein VIGAN_05139400, partial [Vigna angularis var. angularis]
DKLPSSHANEREREFEALVEVREGKSVSSLQAFNHGCWEEKRRRSAQRLHERFAWRFHTQPNFPQIKTLSTRSLPNFRHDLLCLLPLRSATLPSPSRRC